MRSINDLPRYVIRSKSDISLFIGIFLHIWDDLDNVGIKIENLQNEIDKLEQEGASEALILRKHELDSITEIRPHEKKTAEILSRMLETILDNTYGNHAIYIFFAEHYHDRYYRDIYSMYYSKKYFPLPNTCSRFFLFDGEHLEQILQSQESLDHAFIGSIVRRPLQGREIGRTLIDPRYILKINEPDNFKSNIWRNNYKMTMFGIPLNIWAFPYTMQDGEVATCAETTILNMTDYYSYRYPEYRVVLPSEISRTVRKNSNARTIPSRGLSYEMVSKIFMELGFSPILYSAENIKSQFADILHSYVASGIPVALGINDGLNDEIGHSVIVIGTEHRLIDADSQNRKKSFDTSPILRIPDRERDITYYQAVKGALDNSYIIMDDGRVPYAKAKIYERNGSVYLRYLDEKDKEWQVSIFVAPTSSEMSMDAYTAINCFRSLLVSDIFGYSDYVYSLDGLNETQKENLYAGLEKNRPLLTRIFLCQSKRLKEQRIRQYEINGDQESLEKFQKLHLPRFIWVCELYTEWSYTEGKPKCVGEIVLDATTGFSPVDDTSSILWIKYPWKCAFRLINQDGEELKKQMKEKVDIQNCDWWPLTPYKFELH